MASTADGFKRVQNDSMEVRSSSGYEPRWLDPPLPEDIHLWLPVAPGCLGGFPEASGWPQCDAGCCTGWTCLEPIQQGSLYILMQAGATPVLLPTSPLRRKDKKRQL